MILWFYRGINKMDDEKILKYMKQYIKYGELLGAGIISLPIPLLGMIIWGIIIFIYDFILAVTGALYFPDPMLFTILLIGPIIFNFIMVLYVEIRLGNAYRKLNKIDFPDAKEMNDNLNQSQKVSNLYYISNLLGNKNTNAGALINVLSIFTISKNFAKNKKILKKHETLFTKSERNRISFLKFLLYAIPIACMLYICVVTIINSHNNKIDIENRIHSFNEIATNDFSNYESDTLTLENWKWLVGFDIANDNQKISLYLDNKANIESFVIRILYNKNAPLDANIIKEDLQTIKDKVDQSFGNYYKLEDYKFVDVEFNQECLDNIQNKVYDSVPLDDAVSDTPRRFFKIDDDLELWDMNDDSEQYLEISYNFSALYS